MRGAKDSGLCVGAVGRRGDASAQILRQALAPDHAKGTHADVHRPHVDIRTPVAVRSRLPMLAAQHCTMADLTQQPNCSSYMCMGRYCKGAPPHVRAPPRAADEKATDSLAPRYEWRTRGPPQASRWEFAGNCGCMKWRAEGLRAVRPQAGPASMWGRPQLPAPAESARPPTEGRRAARPAHRRLPPRASNPPRPPHAHARPSRALVFGRRGAEEVHAPAAARALRGWGLQESLRLWGHSPAA